MKINNPYQTSLRTKLEKEIEEYRAGTIKDQTLSFRINEYNKRFKENLSLGFGNIGNWDVSRVTEFSQMFRGAANFQPICSWNVSNIVNPNENK